MKYVLVVPLPKGPATNYLEAIIRQLSEHFGLETYSEQYWPYAVVHEAFEIPDERIAEFQKLMSSSFGILSEAEREILFAIDGYTHFENLIGLKVIPSPRMELIVEMIHETLACLPWVIQGRGGSSKNFYVTVTERFHPAQFDDIWKHLAQKSVPYFEASSNTVELLHLEEDLWVVDSVYSLAP